MEQGTFLGVDRATLAAVLAKSWRPDYASESLGALMNRLASDPSAALVPAKYAAANGLRLGDRIVVKLNDLGESHEVPFVIAGTVSYFPTLYEEKGPYVIGNLDYSFDQQGGAYPFQIWMDLRPGTPIDPIRAMAYGYNLSIAADTPAALIQADELRPERQGLFGLLSVGFMAAALVTIVGFLAHTLLSFQRRLVELGMLRAIGMTRRQTRRMIRHESVVTALIGAALGIVLGLVTVLGFAGGMGLLGMSGLADPDNFLHLATATLALYYGSVAAGTPGRAEAPVH
jgi:putative ABC transport system permease protein